VTDYEFAVVRLTPEGKLDGSFGTGGIKLLSIPVPGGLLTSNDKASAVAIDPADGASVLVGGSQDFGPVKFAVARLKGTDGSLDTANFGTNGISALTVGNGVAFLTALAIQPDDRKIVAAGYTEQTPKDFAVVRLDAQGAADGSFGPGGIQVVDFGGSDGANAAAIDPTDQ